MFSDHSSSPNSSQIFPTSPPIQFHPPFSETICPPFLDFLYWSPLPSQPPALGKGLIAHSSQEATCPLLGDMLSSLNPTLLRVMLGTRETLDCQAPMGILAYLESPGFGVLLGQKEKR